MPTKDGERGGNPRTQTSTHELQAAMMLAPLSAAQAIGTDATRAPGPAGIPIPRSTVELHLGAKRCALRQSRGKEWNPDFKRRGA